MKVHELIAELRQYPGNTQVLVRCLTSADDDEWSRTGERPYTSSQIRVEDGERDGELFLEVMGIQRDGHGL